MSIDRGRDKEDMVHIYYGILLNHQKEWNNAIGSNMDAVRNYHTKLARQRKTNIIWYYLYVESREINANELIYKTEIYSDTENKLMVTERGRKDKKYKIRVWDYHKYTTICKIDNEQGPTV